MNPTPNPSSLWEMQWSNGWQGDLQFDGFGSKTLTGHCAVLLSIHEYIKWVQVNWKILFQQNTKKTANPYNKTRAIFSSNTVG